MILTTADRRTCPRCAILNAEELAGGIVEASSILVRLEVGDA
jgi:hypothetical protein